MIITGKTDVPQVPQVAETGRIEFEAQVERFMRDPQIDVVKLERLLDLWSQKQARDAEREFDVAMSAAQAEMRTVVVDSDNPQTRSRYASYQALDQVLRPIYTRHGFAPSFNTAPAADPLWVTVLCRVSHRAGHAREYRIDMPADGKGAKGGDVMTRTHAVGSAVTYGKRYLLMMVFNVVVGRESDDDDGNAAGGHLVSAEQVADLRKLVKDVKANEGRFLHFLGVKDLGELPASRYQYAVAQLQKKKQKGKS